MLHMPEHPRRQTNHGEKTMNTSRILLTIAAAATLSATLCQTALARRGDDDRRSQDHSHRSSSDHCTSAPRSQWLPRAGFAERGRKQGYNVVKIELSGTCYEVYGTRNGILYELYFNPATGDLVRVERED